MFDDGHSLDIVRQSSDRQNLHKFSLLLNQSDENSLRSDDIL